MWPEGYNFDIAARLLAAGSSPAAEPGLIPAERKNRKTDARASVRRVICEARRSKRMVDALIVVAIMIRPHGEFPPAGRPGRGWKSVLCRGVGGEFSFDLRSRRLARVATLGAMLLS